MTVWYMNGAGNDFMVLDARGKDYDFSALAVELCAKTGADGFMAVDYSEKADFRLHFYNSDGSRGEMCGNGSRCICRFAYDNGIAGETMSVETDAGIIYGWRLNENDYRVKLNNPGIVDLTRTENAAYVEIGAPGVPHGVTELLSLSWEQAESLRPLALALRHHKAFPKGANINLFTLLSPTEARVLTFERGVEDYTLACGTGCASVAVTLYLQGRLPGKALTAHCRGGDLKLRLEGSGDAVTGIYLEGPTQVVEITP